MTAKWKKYDGSTEQMNSIFNAENGVIFYYKDEYQSPIIIDDFTLNKQITAGNIAYYLICEPLPHAEMIAKYAITGQVVECRYKDLPDDQWEAHTPAWDADYEYRFKEPEKEKIYYRCYLRKENDIRVIESLNPENVNIKIFQEQPYFLKWIDTDWQEVEID